MAEVVVECQDSRMLSASDVTRLRAELECVANEVAAVERLVIGEVRCLIVDEVRISELHERFFNDPSPTDVITFPAHEDSHGEPVEGDIAICLDVARSQASTAGHSVLREIAFLGVHGLLHLCGWRDHSPAERDAMLDYQDKLLSEREHCSGPL